MPQSKSKPKVGVGESIKQPGDDPAYDAWFREQVEIGLREADRGELIPDEVVRAEWRKKRTGLLRRSQKSK